MRISESVIRSARQAFEESKGSITAAGLKPLVLRQTGEPIKTSTAEYLLSRIRKENGGAVETKPSPVKLTGQSLRQEFSVPMAEFMGLLGLGSRRLMSIGLDEDSVIVETEHPV